MKRITSAFLIFLFVLQTVFLCGCAKKKEKFTDYSFDYFDTVTTIIGFEENKEIFNKNCDKIKEKFNEYHKLYTIYNQYDGINNLSKINDSNGENLKVDSKIIDMLQFAMEMFTLTDGKVNVAMGSVLSIWHKYREEGINYPENAKLPKMSELKSAYKHTDINNLIIDRNENTVFLSDPKMTLDVGAVAKGYATEQVALWMEENGITGYLLNVGGNIRIVGKRADGEKWNIGIENPDTEDKENPYVEYLDLEGMSLVTSGSYQRFYEVDDKKYHHIIDPETLMPSDYFESVSVLCDSSATADALSTALFSMSYEEGRKLVESLEDTYALWITKDGKKLYSEGFENFCKN